MQPKVFVNCWLILSLAFLFAALGSPIACTICFFMILMMSYEAEIVRQAFTAMVLSCLTMLIALAFNIVSVAVSLIGLAELAAITSTVIATCNNLVGILVFVFGVYASINAYKEKETELPFISKLAIKFVKE